MARKKGRKARIRIRQSAKLVNKNDKTRVHKPDTTRYPRVQGRPPADAGATFRIKIRRK